MSFHDAQSQNCSRQIVGSPKPNNFGDDSTFMRFSPLREAQLKKMLSDIPHDLRPKLDRWLRVVVKEEIELAHKNQATTSMHGEGDSVSRSLELRFSNDIVSTLLTGHVLKAVGGVPLEVSLVDSCSKEAVKSGVEASGRVEIVVLDDGVTGGEDVKSNEILVLKMEGSKSRRLGSSLCLNLIQGSAILPMVAFLRNGVYMKNSKLRLGAKFVSNCNGFRVKEAKTGPFLLKDLRNDAYTKRPIPSLRDHVWRLYKVDKKGSLAKNMRQAEIITVGDFLVHLFRQTQSLKEIFDNSNHAKSWKTTVNHARKCPAKLKYCSTFDPKTEVVFNVSGEVMGLSQDNRFLSSDKLSQTQKEDAKNLVISAFENWKDVVHVEEDEKTNHGTYNNHGHHHQLPKIEPVTPRTFCKDVVLDALELKIDETCLFGDMNISDGKPPNPELLPESLRRKYNEIYHGFESVCNIPNRIQPEGAQKNRLCNTWKILFCVVTFKIRSLTKNDLDDIRAHKKPRMAL